MSEMVFWMRQKKGNMKNVTMYGRLKVHDSPYARGFEIHRTLLNITTRHKINAIYDQKYIHNFVYNTYTVLLWGLNFPQLILCVVSSMSLSHTCHKEVPVFRHTRPRPSLIIALAKVTQINKR